MSTSETVSFKACDCPCGAGEVTRHVTTQDNPWSSADIHLTLDCPVCAQAWQLRFEALELIESLQPYRAASTKEHAAQGLLDRLVAELVDAEFTSLALPSKKAELETMKALNIAPMSYQQYTRARQSLTPGQLANAEENPSWLEGIAEKFSKGGVLASARAALVAAAEETKAAGKKIVRIKVPKMQLGS